MDAGVIIALIGVAGGIWAQIIQFKKDGQRIEGVNKTSSDVRNDTREMKPKIGNIEKNTNIIKDDIIRTLIPNISNISDLSSNVSELLEAKRIEDRFREKVSPALGNPEYIKGAVDLIYERNAKLEIQVMELVNKINIKDAQIKMLEQEKDFLKAGNSILMNENTNLKNQLYGQNRDEAER